VKRCCYVIIGSDRRSPCELFVLYPPLPRTCHSELRPRGVTLRCLRIFPSPRHPAAVLQLGWFPASSPTKMYSRNRKVWCGVQKLKKRESKILANSSLFRVTSTHCDTGWYSSDDWTTLACKTVTLCVLTNLKQKLTLMCILHHKCDGPHWRTAVSHAPVCGVPKLLKLYYGLARLCQE